jgi:hypothetical protein
MQGTTTRAMLALLAMTGLAGCASPSPDRPGGVGFGDYGAFLAQREAALAASSAQMAPLSAQSAVPGAGAPQSGAALPQSGGASPLGASGISDENSFDAVALRETIESDRARLEANRAAYQQVVLSELPQRSGVSAPNLAAYALSAPNVLGQPIYNRSPIKLFNHERACAKFASPDLAQTDFLSRGGPESDFGNLDPDGDGFACAWDPTPFQRVRG